LSLHGLLSHPDYRQCSGIAGVNTRAKEQENRMGKTAIVTGASQGIGKACALALLRAGWNTVLVSRNQAKLETVIQEAGVAGRYGLALAGDVSDAAAMETLFRHVAGKFGRVDLLFNNAGISGPAGTIDEIPLDQWEQTVDVNLRGMFNCARAAFAVMKMQDPCGGRIINNGSIAAHAPRPKTVPYTMTKHAVTGLTKCLSLDGREWNIACSQIDIGNVRTEMSIPMTKGMLQANGERRPEPVFELPHVADALLYMAGLPLEVNVQFMTVMATGMPFIGRG
jgi:NAD(P)-dependent dehydrogenase (short-subunit alcohol dehydrogenase family)